MARMHQSDRLTYPSFGALVSEYLPTLPTTRPDTFDAFVRHSGLSVGDARDALQWGTGPQLRFGATYLPGSVVGYTVWTGGPGTAVWIRPAFARAIEEDWARWEARLRAEALVLHELVHCGGHRSGREDGAREIGSDFERAAYHGFRPVYLDYRLEGMAYPDRLRSKAPPATVGAG